MERPFVVCHMLASLDGKIDGAFFGAPQTAPALQVYGELRGFYGCQATLYGTTTMLGGYADGKVLRFLSSWYAAFYLSLSSPAVHLLAQPHSPRQQNLLVNRNRLSRWNHLDRRLIGTVPFSPVQSSQT